MQNFTCPNEHQVTVENDDIPTCHKCNLVATHLNRKDGIVYNWTPIDKYEKACERLQDAMDEAFDNQYFNEGW